MNPIVAYFSKPILKVSLIFAAVAGIAAFLFFLALYLLGIPPLGSGHIFDAGIYIILVASACWYYRRKYGNGFLHLWEGLTMGYFITMVAAMINGWLIYLFVSYVDYSVFTEYIQAGLAVLAEGRTTNTKYLTDKEYLDLYNSIKNNKPSILISNEITQRLLVMIIPILVISLIFRKQDYGVFQNKS
ncbi:DUF4199 domain-containing protein [Dyadobacter sandarakinus]|uniref:DUF4199 domain-containing protein n=1 Tax=Dyadobacter sandarakinus TaxID=2747268 RepID=A0ABX7I7X9_9BACT|nr:DUF4199 domain-containing protein [Dyadobacter sandarakinus]QRR02206.1 DUF4199 domain-containing protein [Dyadobacter sandarakinus]